MQRYFAKIIDNHAILTDEDAFHVLRVMRAKTGEEIEIVNEGTVYIGKIVKTRPLVVEIVEKTDENHELNVDLVLVMSILKGEKLDLVLQKATEIGAKEIILVRSERSIGKIRSYEVEHKLKRFQKIAKEASEQSKRSIIPSITKVIDFKQIALLSGDYMFMGATNEEQTAADFVKIIKTIKAKSRIYVLVGPEGGFSEREVDFAKRCGFLPVSLGRRILRAETASISLLSVIATLLDGQ